jgi:hypothetical protein
MRWAIEIQSTGLEQRNLQDLLRRIGFELVHESPKMALTSVEIDHCSSAQEVYAAGKKLREKFIGSAKIDPDFKLGPVIDYSTSPVRRHAFAEASDSVHGAMCSSTTV